MEGDARGARRIVVTRGRDVLGGGIVKVGVDGLDVSA